MDIGHAIAHAVSRRLPTASGRVRYQVRSCGNCDGQSGTGAGFLLVLWFPLPILIAPTALHSSVQEAEQWPRHKVDSSVTPPRLIKYKNLRPLMFSEITFMVLCYGKICCFQIQDRRARFSNVGMVCIATLHRGLLWEISRLHSATATVEITIIWDFTDRSVPYFGRTCCLQVQNRKFRISSNLRTLHAAVLYTRLRHTSPSNGSVNLSYYRLRRKYVHFCG
jgi:hypothetical protein